EVKNTAGSKNRSCCPKQLLSLPSRATSLPSTETGRARD
ncbi:hypothetical protein N339_10864, partial [Pterocles gutturalis]